MVHTEQVHKYYAWPIP